MSNKKKVSNEVLTESYSRLNNVWQVAKEVGLCGQTVHERLTKLGVQKKINKFTENDFEYLKENYIKYLLNGEIKKLANEMGRTTQFLCRKADKLGLTDLYRKKSDIKGYSPPKTNWNVRPHPKGMKNKKHTQETKDRISVTSKISQAIINSNEGKRYAITKKMMDTKFAKGTFVNSRHKQTWKAGWREIGGKRKYFRSRWEANYARYLEFLKLNNEIIDWQHEPKVFWFEGIKRGCVSYLPDYSVILKNNITEYHEVKGWMDDRSKTKIKRMGIYFPEVTLKIIDAKWFKQFKSSHSDRLIKDWEE
jgi:hypothetical protein